MTVAEQLPKDTAHVWYVATDEIASLEALDGYRALMTPEELAREARYRFEKDRKAHRVARALIRTTLSRYAGVAPADWRFAAGAHGRPDVDAPAQWRSLRFNVSHTPGLVALIVNWEAESGVDVEWRARASADVELADRYFSPAEVADLLQVAPERQRRAFFDYWTLKESYIKARGMGLALPLDQFSFILRADAPIGIAFDAALDDDPARWHFERHYPTPEHTLSLAVSRLPGGPPQVVIRKTTL